MKDEDREDNPEAQLKEMSDELVWIYTNIYRLHRVYKESKSSDYNNYRKELRRFFNNVLETHYAI